MPPESSAPPPFSANGTADGTADGTAAAGEPRWLLLVFYAALAVLLTWPLVTHLGSRVPMGAHDVWQNYWNFWWWKTALFERFQSPFHTDAIFAAAFPEGGVPLGCHTHSPANILLTLPVQLLLGTAAALNTAVLLGFVLAGLGAHLLAREYGAGRGAAFLAGIVYAYFPQHVEQSLEHLNLASTQGLPLALWALVRLLRRGGARRALGAGALFAYNALLSWHHGIQIIPLAAAVIVFEVIAGARRKRIAIDLALAAAVASIIVAPFLAPLIDAIASGETSLRKVRVSKPIDPLFLLLPHAGQPLWGGAVADIHQRFRLYPSVGFVSYLGVAALCLAMLAPVRLPRRADADAGGPSPAVLGRAGAWLWLAIGAFYLTLALGDTLTVARQEHPAVPLPFRWLQEVPIFGLTRVANRFLVPVSLALAVLVGLGGERLLGLMPGRRRRLALAVLVAVVALDYAWLPFPMRAIPRDPWVDALAAEPAGAVVLDIPSGHSARAADDMLRQTRHGLRLAGGYTATPLERVGDVLERFPVLRRVLERYPPEESLEGPTIVEAARALGIDIIIVHRDRAVGRIAAARDAIAAARPGDVYALRLENPETGIDDATLEALRAELRADLGAPRIAADGDIEIFRVAPDAPRPQGDSDG